MEEDDENPQKGGVGAAGSGFSFNPWCRRCSLRLRDLGGHPPHEKRPGRVPGPCGASADGVAPAEKT